MIRVLSIFGTRPEAIKMAPVIHALTQHPQCESRVCVTAQHRDMLDRALRLFEIVPHHDLAIMTPGQDLYDVTAKTLLGLKDVLAVEKPDLVLVHGDTTTTLAATLASFYAGVPVGHVEAGLRTGDLSAPWPEEANRVLVDRLSNWHFAPTAWARSNLLREAIAPDRIVITGNTGIDALLWMRDRIRATPSEAFREEFGSAWEAISSDATIVLITGHRRESFGDGFDQICTALKTLAESHREVHFVYPVHLNPNVQAPVRRHLSGVPNVHLLAPLDYAPFVRLMDRSRFIVTDSGGIQEEAPALGKPVLVLRSTTERPEGVEAGTVALVGTQCDSIVNAVEKLLTDPAAYDAMSRAHNPYGDGTAAKRIVAALEAMPVSPSA